MLTCGCTLRQRVLFDGYWREGQPQLFQIVLSELTEAHKDVVLGCLADFGCEPEVMEIIAKEVVCTLALKLALL